MAKIKLGARPKNFKRVIKFPLVEGGEGAIECIYKYRTRTEFGQFIDALSEAAQVPPSKDEAGEVKFSMAEMMERLGDSSADYIMQVLEGWNLDEEFTRDNVQCLADEIPAAANAIMETYRLAVTEGRLGN